MAVVSAAVDAVVALFSLTMAVAAPLFDSQVVLPANLYPAPLVGIFRWFVAEFGHYVVADPPPFFRGLGILARRRWSAATSLMAGVHMLTYLSAMFGEMLGSGRATRKLLQLYALFVVFAIASVLRGLGWCSTQATPAGPSPAHPARKKRV
ncbi:hypothetical protein GQ55_2G099600 [Panicum hallii var. hallii]|uniref:EXPERA domain-containing protein n=1 Tax=Panicum hallii var. hallii TaxID=1504633 RepID=A0A2T7ENC6_9POAL|nr:hypothetical protein GQ55_2G099600 [Panicum hallii var. hallii]